MKINLPSHNSLMTHIMNNTTPKCRNCCYMMYGLGFILNFIPLADKVPVNKGDNNVSK